MVDQSDLVGRQSKDQVTDPHARFLKAREALLLLLELSDQLVHNVHREGFSG
jgi:hypothetical protein